jgi:DNA (cytosine-5)-methyltransferase 1
MNHLDLFSGIGGFSLALEKVGFKTVGFCEVDPYCRLLLQKHWKGVTIHNDIKKLEAKDIKEPIDILTGGFPCQPYSVAGKQKGTDDNRYLWPDMFRVIKEVKPTFIIAENVRGIVNIQDGLVFETVCSDLESEGFEIQPFIIPAAGVGAPHKRERVWIVGYSKHNGSLTSKIRRGNKEINAGAQEGKNKTVESQGTSGSSNNEIMENSRRTLRQGAKFSKENADESKQKNANKSERSGSTSEHYVADSERIHVQGQQNRSGQEQSRRESWWEFEPNVGRVANGVPGRIYRLKGLGNSIVPQIAEEIGKAIWKTLNQN